jgi:hypothetical protein
MGLLFLLYVRIKIILSRIFLKPDKTKSVELTGVQIIIGGVVNGHVACKYIYVRIFRKTDRMHKNDFVAVGSWALILFVTWVIAWVIASAIPVFNNLLSLIV